MIRVEGLSKHFGSVRAVDALSFSVQPGEVVGLLGPNGAGKTTTLRVLAGLLTPTTGTAFIGGFDVTKEPISARKSLGFLTASTGLYERLTPREMLSIFGQLAGMDDAALHARVESLAQTLELKGFIDRRCGTLSQGQRQRVSIARAIVHEPPVYVLDEPTANLDPVASTVILDLVTKAAAQNKAIVFSTHRMDEAEFLCTRILFMREGRLVAEGTAQSLLEHSGKKSLTAAFLHYAKGTSSS
jgi:sodium transport system ATP-binding protein